MNIKKELPLLLIVAMPFAYLAYIWNDLPAKVPMHWNADGKIVRFGSKLELLTLVLMLPVLTYIIMLVVPKIDPKGQIEKMGNKYAQIRFFLTIFMSVLALIIISSAKTQKLINPNFIFILIGALYTILARKIHRIFLS